MGIRIPSRVRKANRREAHTSPVSLYYNIGLLWLLLGADIKHVLDYHKKWLIFEDFSWQRSWCDGWGDHILTWRKGMLRSNPPTHLYSLKFPPKKAMRSSWRSPSPSSNVVIGEFCFWVEDFRTRLRKSSVARRTVRGTYARWIFERRSVLNQPLAASWVVVLRIKLYVHSIILKL